jgi:hypothetical protein
MKYESGIVMLERSEASGGACRCEEQSDEAISEQVLSQESEIIV